jgi:hypothetical protein
MTTNTYTGRSQGAHRAKAGIVSGAGRLEVLVLLATIAIGIALGVVFGSFFIGFGAVAVLAVGLILIARLLGLRNHEGSPGGIEPSRGH